MQKELLVNSGHLGSAQGPLGVRLVIILPFELMLDGLNDGYGRQAVLERSRIGGAETTNFSK